MRLKNAIPNALTLLNLLCGCIGLVHAFKGDLKGAGLWILAAGIFDFLDGFAARGLNAQTKIGKELDSLADVVSFGVLPASIMFVLAGGPSPTNLLPYLSYSIALAAALRLAIFNVDLSQEDDFRGLPTPAMALAVASFPFAIGENFLNASQWISGGGIVLISLLLSALMLTRIRLFSLKFKDFTWRNNGIRFIFVGLAGVSLLIWGLPSVSLVILLYIALSLVQRKPQT